MGRTTAKKKQSKRAQKKAMAKRSGEKKAKPGRKGGNRKEAKVNRAKKEKIHKLMDKRLPDVLSTRRSAADVFAGESDAENDDSDDLQDADLKKTTGGDESDDDDEVFPPTGTKGCAKDDDNSNQHEMSTAFATKLSHTEKSIRDKGFKSLQKWLKKRADKLTELDFVKLWRALFYCLWMSDKKPVQQALSVHIAQLTQCIDKEKVSLWMGAFLEVMQTEWPKLDTWRMNKFLLMVRIQMAEMFSFVQKQDWESEVIESLNDVYLSIAPLSLESAFNPGFAQHFAACFWDEFAATAEAARKSAAAANGVAGEDNSAEADGANKKNKAKKKKTKAANSEVETKTKAKDQDGDERINAAEEKKVLTPATDDTTLHFLEPFLQVLADPAFSDTFAKAIVNEILGAKLPKNMREPIANELFDIATDDEVKPYKREALLSLVRQLQEADADEPVVLPLREPKINPRLEAPKRKLRKGLGVRTRNQRKVRQRDKR
ncbi:unnamed protein product [Amoebophrya sp. A25]|nr:unnamed protein product [Amoebophrya sp. A25]|eukprot:GSA25T00019624001.1